MSIIMTALALVASTQAATAVPVDHSQHNATQHAQHQQAEKGKHEGQHDCCKQVNGKMECQMMKGHGAEKGQGEHQGHSRH